MSKYYVGSLVAMAGTYTLATKGHQYMIYTGTVPLVMCVRRSSALTSSVTCTLDSNYDCLVAVESASIIDNNTLVTRKIGNQSCYGIHVTPTTANTSIRYFAILPASCPAVNLYDSTGDNSYI